MNTVTSGPAPQREVPKDLSQQLRRGGRAVGAIFFAIFGGIWLLFGFFRAHWSNYASIAVSAAGALLIVLAAVRVLRQCRIAMAARRTAPEGRRMRRWFRIINAAQWAVIIIAAYFLESSNLARWIVPAVMLVVGLHMLPLARLFRYPPHYLTGAALTLTALVYPFAAPGGPDSPLGCLIAGVALWLSALWALRAGAAV